MYMHVKLVGNEHVLMAHIDYLSLPFCLTLHAVSQRSPAQGTNTEPELKRGHSALRKKKKKEEKKRKGSGRVCGQSHLHGPWTEATLAREGRRSKKGRKAEGGLTG